MSNTQALKDRKTWKATVKSLGVVTTLYVCFVYLGGFSSQQSAVLVVLGWLGYERYEKMNDRLNVLERSDKFFSAFRVHIRPNWKTLLSDFRLVCSEEGWNQLNEATLSTEYNVFHDGISFTVIAPPSGDCIPPGLIYSDDRRTFLNGANLSAYIVENHRSMDGYPLFKNPPWGLLPRLLFKAGRKGYDIGLSVPYEWWRNICQTEGAGDLAKIKSHIDDIGTTSLIVATIPYSEFGIYYAGSDYDRMEWEQTVDKELQTNGWKRPVKTNSEISDDWSRVEHKYLAVSHRAI